MNRYHILLLLSIIVGPSAIAFGADSNVLSEKALETLSSKWHGKAIHIGVNPANRVTRTTVSQIANSAQVVNVESDGRLGFVMFAGNGADAQMIGYGLNDTIHIQNIPPMAEEFISNYNKAVIKASQSTSQGSGTYPNPTVAHVEPFIKAKWGQGAPFNAKCPKYQGKPSVTGCDAVALSQVLYHFKADNFNPYTIEYKDEMSLAEVSVNFGQQHFKYDKMLDVYTEGNYTQEQADAVAEMMYVTGASALMKWSDEKSSGQWPLVSLDKYFNFNATFLIRKSLPTGYWMKKIQENLTAGKPILYTGAGVSSSKWSQHIFVLDGIDENNYVHVNWGWAGEADGYYDITFCHPSFFEADEDGYYSDQKMICDISPRANGEMYSERFVCTSGSPMTNLNDQNDYIEGRFTGYTTNSYESLADYNAKIVAVKGSEVKVLGAADHYYLKQFPNWGYIGWNAESNGKPHATVPLDNGEWELMIATYEYDTDEMVSYHPLPMRPFFIISDGVFTEKGYKDYPEGKTEWRDELDNRLSINAFEPQTDVMAKAPFVVKIKSNSLITSIDSHDIKRCYIGFKNIETGKTYWSDKRIDVYNLEYSGLHYEGYAIIDPPTNKDNGFTMPNGRYELIVDETENPGIVFPEPIYIDVCSEVDYPVLIYDITGTLMLDSWNDSYYIKKWGDKLQFRKNANYKGIVSSNNCYAPVTINAYGRRPGEDISKEILVSTFEFNPTNGFGSNDFEIPGNLYPLEGEYMFYLRYLTPDGEKTPLPSGIHMQTNDWIEKYGMMTLPTRHNITANLSSGLQMLEVSETNYNGILFSFKIKNIGTANFLGNMVVRTCTPENGKISESIVENVILTPGEQKALSVEMSVSDELACEAYILSKASDTRSVNTDYTFATKTDGSVAHYRLGKGSGISNCNADKSDIHIIALSGTLFIEGASDSDSVEIFAVDGSKIVSTKSKVISGIENGIYIVRVKNHSFKVRI